MYECRPNMRHTSLAIYVLMRGLTLLVRCGNQPDAPPLVRRFGTVKELGCVHTALPFLANSF